MQTAIGAATAAYWRTSQPSHGERLFGLLCSITLLLGTILYYTVFQYRLYFVALIVVVIGNLLVRGRMLTGLRAIAPLVIFEAYQALSSFWSPDYREGLGQSALDLIFVSFAFIPLMYSDFEKKWFSLALIRWYAIALLCCIGFNAFMLGELIDVDKGAFRSIFGASFLVALAPFAGEAILNKSKVSTGILVIIMTIGLQLESRLFSLFSVPVLLVAVAVCYVTGRKRVRFFYPLAFVLVVLAVLASYQTMGLTSILESSRLGDDTALTFGDTVFNEANMPSADSVDIERRVATRVAFDSFRQSPAFGTGYMSTSYYVGLLTPYQTVAHGLPSGLLAETGIVGTVLFVTMCILATRGYLLRSRICPLGERRWVYIEMLTFITALLAGLFHQADHDFYLFLLAGGGLAARRVTSSYSNKASAHKLMLASATL